MGEVFPLFLHHVTLGLDYLVDKLNILLLVLI